MDYSATKKYLNEAFSAIGFRPIARVLFRDFGEVAVLVAAHKGFGKRVDVDIGFWLKNLKREIPKKVELCHVYLRLERLLPDQREAFLVATNFEEVSQSAALTEADVFLRSNFPSLLAELASEVGLATALRSGKLMHSLIRKEARTHLQSIKLH
jgi:hypothetical protein